MQCACKCKGRWIFVTICSLQLFFVVIRLVFDSLGLLWTPIVACLCQILGVVIGITGVMKEKYRVVCMYSTWTLIWIGWNVFLICYYLELGALNVDQHSIAMDLSLTNSTSWFSGGAGSLICAKQPTITSSDVASAAATRITQDCLVDYKYVEVGLSVLQIVLASFGFIASCYMVGILDDEDYDEYDYMAANLATDKKRTKEDSYQPRTRALEDI